MAHIDRRAALAGFGSLLIAAMGAFASPHRRLANELPPLDLESAIPGQFSGWQIDKSLVPLLPAPDVQERLDALYSQVLSRTYIDGDGRRLMLVMAYGADQSDRESLVHLPTVCYPAQGFTVWDETVAPIAVGGQAFEVARLHTSHGERVEPVTYWTMMGQRATASGPARRWARAQYALMGVIPDGMLVRASTIGADETAGFALQARFIADLFDFLPAATRGRVFGIPA